MFRLFQALLKPQSPKTQHDVMLKAMHSKIAGGRSSVGTPRRLRRGRVPRAAPASSTSIRQLVKAVNRGYRYA